MCLTCCENMFTHLHLHLAPHTMWQLQRTMLGWWGPRGISHSGTSHSSLPCVILNYSVKHFLLYNTQICVRNSKRWNLSLHESSFCSKSERILERTITTFLSASARGIKQKWQAWRGVHRVNYAPRLPPDSASEAWSQFSPFVLQCPLLTWRSTEGRVGGTIQG